MVLLLLIISLVYDIDSDVNQFSKFYAVRYVPMIISVVYGKDSFSDKQSVKGIFAHGS